MPAYTLYSIGVAEQKITENLYDSEAERLPIALFNSCYHKHYTIQVLRIRTGIRFIRIRVDREI